MRNCSVSFVSLGCPKNLVDSEKMLGLLAEAGCPIVGSDAGQADVLVVNTCGFLAAARDEAMEILREAAEQKRRGQIKRLVVAGCLVQRDGQRLIEQIPEIDALVGVHNRRDIVRAVAAKRRNVKTSKRRNVKTVDRDTAGAASERAGQGSSGESRGSKGVGEAARDEARGSSDADGRTTFLGEYQPASWVGANRSDQVRLRLTPAHYAYLRVGEGCDQKCTFCTIPSIRGPMHSKPVDDILAEARELIEDDAVELNVIGQDTTSYGLDIDYERGLAGLLRKLDRLDGVEWIRLMYAYPSNFTDEMIDAIAECDNVVKYVDIPLQHVNDRVLKAMYRRVTREQTETLLDKLRKRIPGVAIRTTFIAGFPGETEAEFEELRQFIRDFGFDALGVFPYSNEPGTPAYRMKDQLPPDVIEARVEELMLTQQEIAFKKAASRVGDAFRVLIDAFDSEGVFTARHQGQAPDVDSLVYVRGGAYGPGEFVSVRCTGSRDYDLIAEPMTEQSSVNLED
ncbi:MAG: 30S ribosomal protein S12 methylthiotransferase RimO [Phycisphaerae bacterium]|nr:30S ribosomal protein S12 methylthiotransferase RimO [Phycisphaerae bacterium]